MLKKKGKHVSKYNHNNGDTNVNYQWKVLPCIILRIMALLYMLAWYMRLNHNLVKTTKNMHLTHVLI